MNVKRVVYVCHPFSNDEHRNAQAVLGTCKRLVAAGLLPIAPQLYLPVFIDEQTERELAMACCLKLVSLCDEVRVYGEPSVGMQLEIAEAELRGIPVVHVESR